ncbi:MULTISPECIES: hypothetical protein [Bacillus]|uniref:Uncharacterized protein n=1 Tax=Bacillus pumilus TaxID=1408 RepID=A0AAE3WHB6_BACPU|nr:MULTISPECIES: hypothetical protein [Bacillus]MCY7618420.1 hypothetical protein [Bacillus pumilus]MDR4248771.1 hypothetical protein [Bacillus pumilus]PAC83758.1 hypothetical protein CHI05_00195 [Bacillus sp. 7788]QKN79350.1 hypothetical protein GZ55_16840 [Bacillus pumilus]QLI44704.1 hypothetical protein DJ67_010130 [Bacillus pumilus]
MRGKRFPDETDWLSFFETEPDERFERGMPIEYQNLTFRFENQDERFVVTMYLGNQEFTLKAVRKKDAFVLGIYDFKTVQHVEIKKDRPNEKELLIIVEAYDDFITTVEIAFLPFFSVMVKEHFSGE